MLLRLNAPQLQLPVMHMANPYIIKLFVLLAMPFDQWILSSKQTLSAFLKPVKMEAELKLDHANRATVSTSDTSSFSKMTNHSLCCHPVAEMDSVDTVKKF